MDGANLKREHDVLARGSFEERDRLVGHIVAHERRVEGVVDQEAQRDALAARVPAGKAYFVGTCKVNARVRG